MIVKFVGKTIIVLWIVFLYTRIKETTQKDLFSSHFARAIKKPDFIDKTLFISDMFNIEGNCYLSMPKKIGKTTLLDMTKKFLEIEVNKNGDPLSNLEEPVNDTSNYEFFVENDFEVLKENETMKHFGRHPVIDVDFKCSGDLKSFDDFLNVCRSAIHKSFKEHKYLQNSKKLTKEEKEICKKWCDDTEFKNISETEIINSLRNLSSILYKHFDGRKAFALIDDDDDPVIKSFEGIDDEWKKEESLDFMGNLIITLFKNNPCLEQGLVAGIHSCFESTDYKIYTPKDAMNYQRQFENLNLFNWRPMTITLNYIG